MRMEAGEEKGGWESGFFFLIFTDIVKKYIVRDLDCKGGTGARVPGYLLNRYPVPGTLYRAYRVLCSLCGLTRTVPPTTYARQQKS